MKPVQPLYRISVDNFDRPPGVKHVYFTFSTPKQIGGVDYHMHDQTFRARFSLGDFDKMTVRELCGISKEGRSPQEVADDIRRFAKDHGLESEIGTVPEQIEAGEGPDTRSGDELFED